MFAYVYVQILIHVHVILYRAPKSTRYKSDMGEMTLFNKTHFLIFGEKRNKLEVKTGYDHIYLNTIVNNGFFFKNVE